MYTRYTPKKQKLDIFYKTNSTPLSFWEASVHASPEDVETKKPHPESEAFCKRAQIMSILITEKPYHY